MRFGAWVDAVLSWTVHAHALCRSATAAVPISPTDRVSYKLNMSVLLIIIRRIDSKLRLP